MRFPKLMPDEHIYSALVRARFVNAEMHISDRSFFTMHDLPFHWIRSQTPLCSNLNAVIALMASMPDEIFRLRMAHAPFAPWLLSLPDDMKATELTSSGGRSNVEESPYMTDKRWKFCPNCARDERKRLGFSYWHASHQLLGVRGCTTHQTALYSHDKLRYLDFTLPTHWIDKAEALSCVPWQEEWQEFICSLSARIQAQPSFAQCLVADIKKCLKLDREIKPRDKPYFNQLSEDMQEDLGKECLDGLFREYKTDRPGKTNIIWVTLSGYGQTKGIRHPLYWLAISFWLRDRLPVLRL